jgi:signal transduction histidine kinase
MPKDDEIVKMKRQLDVIYNVNGFIASIMNLNKLLNLIMEESKKAVNAEASSLMLYDEAKDELYFEVALGDKGDAVKEVRLKVGEGIAGSAAKERRSINVPDVEKDKRFYKYADKQSKFKTKSILAVPLLRGDKLIGVVEVLNKVGGGSFNEEDVKIMEILADQAAITIENAQLVEENIKSARLAAIGQAIAGTAHYIKNILAGVQGSMSLIDMGIDKDNYDMIKNAWPICKRSNLKITKLVRDMLTYSKERQPVKSPNKICDIINEICEMMLERAKQAKVKIIKEYNHKDIEISVDAGAICDALLNLISNSVDAVDKEEGWVKIKTEMVEDERRIRITVMDNGCGIPEEILKKIFDPFFSTKGSKGTGLGLAVTKKVIEEHNGKLEVESTPNVGSSFYITLPIS